MDDPAYHLCDAETLRAIANHLEAKARQYRIRADLLEARQAEQERGREILALAYDSPQLVQAHMAAGMSAEAAITAAAYESGLPPLTVEAHWRRHQRDAQTEARNRRNTQILELARQGLDNATIAERVGLHPVSVSRIISQQIQRRRPAGPEAR